MFSPSSSRYTNDDTTQQFNTNNQLANLIQPRTGQFKSTHVENNTGDILEQSETLAPDYKPPEVRIKNNMIIVNSIDRDWYNYSAESPFNFLVKLGGSYSEQYSIVSNEYHNIVHFSVDKIVLSNRYCTQSYDTANSSVRLNDNPYLTVNIDGINYSSYGTNKTLNNTLGVFTPLTPFPKSISDISYLEFKNTSSQKKEYFPIPEGSISKLNIHINNPIGVIASDLKDVLSIYSIFTNNANSLALTSNDYIIIQTNDFFTANEFCQNDLIIIKNYVYHNPSYDESGIFNAYINRSSGHNILNINKSNTLTTLYNQIEIPIPALLSRSTGNISVDTWYSSFIDKTFSNVAIADNSGKLINANIQAHLMINIKTMEKNNNNLFLKDLI
jgi:hypothetical protein